MRKPALWPEPCTRCHRDGQLGKSGVPLRYTGARVGWTKGALCFTCYQTVKRNPGAELMPERRNHWQNHEPRKPRTQLARLAKAVLAFNDALALGKEEALEAHLAAAVQLAEKVME